jgi:hypothetical protein
MSKAQGLPISTIVIVILCITVAAVFIIYVLTGGGKGFDITQTYWGIGGNLTKNASAQAGQAPTNVLVRCSAAGNGCLADSDCCDKTFRCFSATPGDAQLNPPKKTCNKCSSDFCTDDLDCCPSVPKCCNAGNINAHCEYTCS